jgi:hypothetical protein
MLWKMECLFHGVWDTTEYTLTQYDVHRFIVTGWQIYQPLIPGFLPRCSYILGR